MNVCVIFSALLALILAASSTINAAKYTKQSLVQDISQHEDWQRLGSALKEIDARVHKYFSVDDTEIIRQALLPALIKLFEKEDVEDIEDIEDIEVIASRIIKTVVVSLAKTKDKDELIKSNSEKLTKLLKSSNEQVRMNIMYALNYSIKYVSPDDRMLELLVKSIKNGRTDETNLALQMIERIKTLEKMRYEEKFLRQRLIPALKVALLKDNPDTLKEITRLMRVMLHLPHTPVTAESIVKEQNMTMLMVTKIGFTKNKKHAANIIGILTRLMSVVPELKAQFVELNILARIHELLKELKAIYPNSFNPAYSYLSEKALEFVANIMENSDGALANRLLDQGLLRLVVSDLKSHFSDKHLTSARIILQLVGLKGVLDEEHRKQIEAIDLVSLVSKARSADHEFYAKKLSKIADEILIKIALE